MKHIFRTKRIEGVIFLADKMGYNSVGIELTKDQFDEICYLSLSVGFWFGIFRIHLRLN